VQVADTKIQQLSEEVKQLQESEEINMRKIKNLRMQVSPFFCAETTAEHNFLLQYLP